MIISKNKIKKAKKAIKAGFKTITVTKGGNFGSVAFLRGELKTMIKLSPGEEFLNSDRGSWSTVDNPYNIEGDITLSQLMRDF